MPVNFSISANVQMEFDQWENRKGRTSDQRTKNGEPVTKVTNGGGFTQPVDRRCQFCEEIFLCEQWSMSNVQTVATNTTSGTWL